MEDSSGIVGGHSVACCSTPPVTVKGYDAQGKYEEIGGIKTYVTGPSDAKKGILVHYDIFGYFSQTLQGADIMATLNPKQNYRVVMPDWFKGEAMSGDVIPFDNTEKRAILFHFLEVNHPLKFVDPALEYMKALEAKYPDTTEWATVGYCWGGKVATLLASDKIGIFKAAVSLHPPMVDSKDAESIKVPFCLLASKEENAGQVKEFEAALTATKHVETFADSVHGWMAARADLEDPQAKAAYTRGYKTVVDFLGNNF